MKDFIDKWNGPNPYESKESRFNPDKFVIYLAVFSCLVAPFVYFYFKHAYPCEWYTDATIASGSLYLVGIVVFALYRCFCPSRGRP